MNIDAPVFAAAARVAAPADLVKAFKALSRVAPSAKSWEDFKPWLSAHQIQRLSRASAQQQASFVEMMHWNHDSVAATATYAAIRKGNVTELLVLTENSQSSQPFFQEQGKWKLLLDGDAK